MPAEGSTSSRGPAEHEEEDNIAEAAHHHGRFDPHIWLDFANAQKMVDTICAALVEKDPPNKDFYVKNADDYKRKLDRLDQEYRQALANAASTTPLSTPVISRSGTWRSATT